MVRRADGAKVGAAVAAIRRVQRMRSAELACGFFAFLFIRKSAFAGVLVGEAILIVGMLAFGP